LDISVTGEMAKRQLRWES